MKSVLFRRFCVAAVAVCIGAIPTTGICAQNVNLATGAPPQVVTSGTGESRLSPDRAVISIGVQSRATTAAQAGADNARRQRAILDTLRALGVSSDQLSTTGYSVFPEMNAVSPQAPPKVTGYTVSNTVRVDVRKLDDVSRYIDATLAKGANTMSGLQFYSSKADSARRAAMAMAVANARADAEVIARAAGGTLGPVLSMESEGGGSVRFDLPMAKMAMASPTPIEPGQQTISATVTVRWQFVPPR
ncbi:MAG: SIMPL domain-containing protein [Gemmatimonadaceae bacterium]